MSLENSIVTSQTPTGGFNSDLIAVHNTTQIPVRRADAYFGSASDDGSGNLKLNITALPLWLGALTTADYVVIYGLDIASTPTKGRFQVISLTGTDLVLNTPYVSDIYGTIWFESQTPNYYLSVKSSKPVGLSYIPILETRHYLNSDYSCNIDIRRHKEKAVQLIDSYIPTTNTNFQDSNISSPMRIEISEVWDGVYLYPAITLDKVFVNASMQNGHKERDNMAEYVSVNDGSYLCKFVHPANKARYWKGLPFDINFYISSYLSGADLLRKEFLKNEYGQAIGTNSISLVNTDYENNKVNRISVNGNTTDYSDTVKRMNIQIVNDSNGENVSVLYPIDVCTCDVKNPIYLKALSSVGWVYFLFDGYQVFSDNSQSSGVFSRFNPYLNSEIGTLTPTKKTVQPSISLGAEMLDAEDMTIIREIIESPAVFMLANPTTWKTEDPKWMAVNVKNGDYQWLNNKGPQNRIEFSIELSQKTGVSW